MPPPLPPLRRRCRCHVDSCRRLHRRSSFTISPRYYTLRQLNGLRECQNRVRYAAATRYADAPRFTPQDIHARFRCRFIVTLPLCLLRADADFAAISTLCCRCLRAAAECHVTRCYAYAARARSLRYCLISMTRQTHGAHERTLRCGEREIDECHMREMLLYHPLLKHNEHC